VCLRRWVEAFSAQGDEVEAARVWREALSFATDIHGTPVALEALAGFASLRAKQGERKNALELLLVVLTHPASDQETKDLATWLQD